MKKGIVVVFTGSLGTEIPLLYFGAKIYEDLGYDKLLITCKMTEESEFPGKYDEIYRKINDLNLNDYEDVIFISKSIGTYISCKIKDELKLEAKLILFTPIEETMEFIREDNDVLFVAAGDKDQHLDANRLIDRCVSQNVKYYIEPGVGHSMEILNDINRNIEIVSNVIGKIPVNNR